MSDSTTGKAVRRFIYHFVILAGALSCVLVWLRIEPKDLWGWHVSVSLPHWSWLALAIGLFSVGLVSSGYSLLRSLRIVKQPSKLEIYAAFYGSGPDNDRDVTAILQAHAKDALAFEIENNSFGIDPAPMRLKRLRVEYSYGNAARYTVEREEHSRLVLPQESIDGTDWRRQYLEENQQRTQFQQKYAEAANQVLQLKTHVSELTAALPKPSQYPVPQLRGKIVAMVSELQGFLGAHGDEPIVSRLQGLDNAEYLRRVLTVRGPWRAKFIGDYSSQFGDSLPKLRDEIRAKARIDNLDLNHNIELAAKNLDSCRVAVKEIIKTLWELAIGVNT